VRSYSCELLDRGCYKCRMAYCGSPGVEQHIHEDRRPDREATCVPVSGHNTDANEGFGVAKNYWLVIWNKDFLPSATNVTGLPIPAEDAVTVFIPGVGPRTSVVEATP
jgi:hypothetical protein